MNKNSFSIQSKMDHSSELSSMSVNNVNLERKFVWNNNSDIVQLLLRAQNQPQLFSTSVKIRPLNGSQILYSKSLCNRVRNNDGYIWQKKNQRKTTRENQIMFKVNGVECLLAKYTRSSVLPSFQRRCYFLRQNPDVVFFHYLNVPSLTVDYKLCISSSTLSESDLQGINEITLFEQLTGMFDNFPTQISKMDGFGVVNLDIQSIIRAIVQSIILQKQKKYYIDPPLSNSCYVFSTVTDHRTVTKISHSLSSICKSSIGSDNKNINTIKESSRSNKSQKMRNAFTGPNNWSKARQSDSCIDTAMGNRNMMNLPEEDYFLSRTNSNKMISLIDYRIFNQDLMISSSSNQSMKSNNLNFGDPAVDSQTSISSCNVTDVFNTDPVIITESETMTKMDHNLNDILADSQTYIDSFDLNDCAYWADFEGSVDIDVSGPSCSEPIDESFDISGDFNFDYMSTFQPDCLPQPDIADLSDDNLNLNIVISHYAPSWAPLQGGGSILIAGTGICENLFQQQYCNVIFGPISVPAVVIQNGLLKAEIPAQKYPGEVGVKIQVGQQITGSLIMFKYVRFTPDDEHTGPILDRPYDIHKVIDSWIFQKESQLKVIVVDQMSLLEEEIMKVKVIPNSTIDLKSYDIIENISVDMIRVRRWCCRDSLELVLSRCCFTWCRRALSTLTRPPSKSDSPPTETGSQQTQTAALNTDLFSDPNSVINISLIHAAAGLGYIEFLRLFLIWRLLHLRQLRIYNSNNLNTEESKWTLRWSLERIELISGLKENSVDKNGFSALMWAGLRDHAHALRLLAMWSPRMIMISHRESGLSLVEILKQHNKCHMISHIRDIIDRYNDTNGTFSSPPAGQIDALWECMASTSESEFDDFADIDDILKLGPDCPTDEISSSVNSHHEMDHHSLDSSKCQSMENLDGVNQNDVQMVCLAGRIIQAMPIRIKQKPSSMDCSDIPNRGVSNEENLILNENTRQSSHFRPVLDRNRSFSHSSFSSAGADGTHNTIGSGRLSNGRHTTDDSGISTPFDDARYIHQSPSPNREFNLDSPPPTTAEIADHFNAPACFMEADFSRLTLSDQEQKRLYEAAKLIQKCYRRYRQGKTRDHSRGNNKTSSDGHDDDSPCKKVFLTASKASTYKSKLQYIVNKVAPTNYNEPTRASSNLSNIDDSYQKFPNRIVTKRRFSAQDDQEVEADCQKEIEAAIIIQSYYRRYKQYAYYKRMCQAAVLIQNQFRWYVEHKKSTADHSQNQIINNDINRMSVSQNYRNHCKKRSNTLPNTLGAAYGLLRNLLNSKYRATNIGPCLLPPRSNVKFYPH